MYRIIYSSMCHKDFKVFDILSMLKQAQVNNASQGISGLLLFGNQRFLQVIEGHKKPLLALYDKISKDPRHHDLVIHEEGEVEELHFTLWKMSYISLDQLGWGRGTNRLLAKFTPETNSAEDNFNLLKSIELYLNRIQQDIQQEKLKVWIVDDDPSTRKLFEIFGRANTFESRSFGDPLEVLPTLNKESHPHVLICDLHMPEMNGIELLRSIRSEHEDLPILMMSTDDDEEQVLRSIGLGADGYLFKPFKKEDLYVAIRQALLSTALSKDHLPPELNS